MVVIAMGVTGAATFVLRRSKGLGYATVVLIAIAYGFFFIKYLHEYYVHIPQHLPLANNYGFDELVPFLESQKGNYDKVIVTDRYDQPYILFLFYSKYDPTSFQKQVVLTERDKFNFSTVRQYDNYEFRSVKPEDLSLKRTLVVGTDQEIPATTSGIIKTIYFQNGQPAFRIVGKE